MDDVRWEWKDPKNWTKNDLVNIAAGEVKFGISRLLDGGKVFKRKINGSGTKREYRR